MDFDWESDHADYADEDFPLEGDIVYDDDVDWEVIEYDENGDEDGDYD